MRTVLLLALLLVPSNLHAVEPPQVSAREVTDSDVEQLLLAVSSARGYGGLVTALTQYEAVLVSPRTVEWIDRQLPSPALDANQRGMLMLARLTALDGQDRGAQGAAQLLAVRLIAASVLAADTPQQFADALGAFTEFASIITPALVRTALNTPGNNWPAPLLPLMEQLANDWPRLGAAAAATRMAQTANTSQGGEQTGGETPRGANDPVVVGHWRTTRIVFESSRDDHLVLSADGRAERWSTTSSGEGARTAGRWAVTGSTLNVTWSGDDQTSQPFTMYEGQLVLPNIPGRRVIWERMD